MKNDTLEALAAACEAPDAGEADLAALADALVEAQPADRVRLLARLTAAARTLHGCRQNWRLHFESGVELNLRRFGPLRAEGQLAPMFAEVGRRLLGSIELCRAYAIRAELEEGHSGHIGPSYANLYHTLRVRILPLDGGEIRTDADQPYALAVPPPFPGGPTV